MHPITVITGDRTATYPDEAAAVEALLAAMPRAQRKVLYWMEALRRINQAEAGQVVTGKPETNARAVAGENGAAKAN